MLLVRERGFLLHGEDGEGSLLDQLHDFLGDTGVFVEDHLLEDAFGLGLYLGFVLVEDVGEHVEGL